MGEKKICIIRELITFRFLWPNVLYINWRRAIFCHTQRRLQWFCCSLPPKEGIFVLPIIWCTRQNPDWLWYIDTEIWRRGEYDNNEFKTHLTEKGVKHEMSCPYTPSQNGVSERSNRTIMEAARSMLHSSNSPLWLLSESVKYASYILNRVPSK